MTENKNKKPIAHPKRCYNPEHLYLGMHMKTACEHLKK